MKMLSTELNIPAPSELFKLIVKYGLYDPNDNEVMIMSFSDIRKNFKLDHPMMIVAAMWYSGITNLDWIGYEGARETAHDLDNWLRKNDYPIRSILG